MNRINMVKNRLLYFAVLATAFSFVLFYGGKVPYVILYAALGLLGVSVAYVLILVPFCDVLCFLSRSEVIKGGDVILTMEIKNNCPLFIPYIHITYKKAEEFIYKIRDESLSVAPFSGKRARIVLTSKYRGSYDVNIPQVRLMDFLGIVSVKIKYPKLPNVLVYPRVSEIDEFTAVGRFDLDNNMNPDNITEDVTAVSDVREYMVGDGMRKIHWNLSARMLSFMSKNYENITKSRLTMLINLTDVPGLARGQKLTLEDKMIESAVSIVFHFLNKFWNVTLCYYESEYYTYTLSAASMFGMAYEHLAFVEFSSTYDIAKIVENVSLDMVGERLNLCVITQEITNELIDRVIRYSELGSRIALLYVCKSRSDLDNAEWMEAISKSAVTLYTLDFESELRDVLAQRSSA